MALQIRRTVYRGKQGFLLCGRSPGQGSCKIFDTDRTLLERIRFAYNARDEARAREIMRQAWTPWALPS